MNLKKLKFIKSGFSIYGINVCRKHCIFSCFVYFIYTHLWHSYANYESGPYYIKAFLWCLTPSKRKRLESRVHAAVRSDK